MMLYVCKLFLCFILFSFLGWCLEVLYGRVVLKKFVNRGFLVGPFCPLYGIGCVLLYLLVSKYQDDPIMLMLASMVICSLLEYFTSYIMEKLFKTRWWDYTDMKFNINGRICLEMIVPFGILGLLVVYLLFPFAMHLLSYLSSLWIYILSGILLVVLLTDISISFNIIMKFKTVAYKVPKDRTEEVTKFVRDTLKRRSGLTRRLVESFPSFKIDLDAIKRKIALKRGKKK